MKKKYIIIISTITISLVLIGILAIYFLIIIDTNSGGKYPSIDFRELNDECQEYGLDKWGPTFESYENGFVSRDYRYSVKYDTCIMMLKNNIEDESGFSFPSYSLRDIYREKEILFYDSSCVMDTHRIYKNPTEIEMHKVCGTNSEEFANVIEDIWSEN